MPLNQCDALPISEGSLRSCGSHAARSREPSACLAAEKPALQLRCRSASPRAHRTDAGAASLRAVALHESLHDNSVTSQGTGGRPPRSPQLQGCWMGEKGSRNASSGGMDQWPSTAELRRLWSLAEELFSVWEEFAAAIADREQDCNAVVSLAISELLARLEAWRHRRAAILASCEEIRRLALAQAKCLAGDFVQRLDTAGETPLTSRLKALESLAAEISLEYDKVQELRNEIGNCLQMLGRRSRAEAIVPLGDLQDELHSLHETIKDHQLQLQGAREALEAIWTEMGVEPHGSLDLQIRDGRCGVTDEEQNTVKARVAFWEAQQQGQQHALSELHSRIRSFGEAANLEGDDLMQLEMFLEEHLHCRDLNDCVARQHELEQLIQQRLEKLEIRRQAACLVLGEDMTPQSCEDLCERAQGMQRLVDELDAQVDELRRTAWDSGARAREIWEELGQSPNSPEDDAVVALLKSTTGSADLMPGALAAVRASRLSWERRREEVAVERDKLHVALGGFGESDEVNEFLRLHGGLKTEDLEACRTKLQELQAAARAAEEPLRERLRHLYDVSGVGHAALEAFLAQMELEATSLAERRRMLLEENGRMDRYYESVRGILGQLDELKALVVQGARFEGVTQSGQNRFSGNSLHFLEEEKFRKMFARRYPSLRDALITAISEWESSSTKVFVYHGQEVRQQLTAMRGMESELVRAPGDLSVVGKLLQLLDVHDVSVEERASRASSRRPSAEGSRSNSSRPPRASPPASRGESPSPAVKLPRPPKTTLAAQARMR